MTITLLIVGALLAFGGVAVAREYAANVALDEGYAEWRRNWRARS